MAAQETVFGDLGGGKQSAGAPIPNIGETPDDAVTEDRAAPTIDGEPVSPYVAARRFGAAAGQGYRGTNPDPGAP